MTNIESALVASCNASGVLHVGQTMPKGNLPIATEISPATAARIKTHCRLAYDGESYLVPGIPEAPDQLAGVDALLLFQERLRKLEII